jgi:tight adherence protein B
VLLPLALLYPGIRTKNIIRKRRNELNLQFKDLLYSVSSSLSTGKSLESSFRDAARDLSIIYPDPETSIIVEIGCINRRLEMNGTVEAALVDFAARSRIDDIVNFADVICTCRRTGGNMAEVARNASNIINDKIEIRQEIEVLLAERKLEQKLLNVLPLGMVILLSWCAGDYIAPVYTTIAGRLAMTAAILLLGAAWFISKKISDIKI